MMLALLPFLCYLTTVFAATTRIDDSDAAFTFTGSWNTGCYATPDINSASGKTYHDGGKSGGAGGSLRFKGNAVTVYGITIQHEVQGVIRFKLDNQAEKVYSNANTAAYGFNVVEFEASGLSADQEHVLTFTVDTSSWGGGSAIIDYAVVTVDDKPTTVVAPPISTTTSQPATTAVPTTSKTSSLSSSTTPSTITASTAPAAGIIYTTAAAPTLSEAANSAQQTVPADPSGGSSSSKGPIIGAAIAGVAGVILVFFAVWFFLKKRRQSKTKLSDMEYNGTGGQISFIPPQAPHQTYPASYPSSNNWPSPPPSEIGSSVSGPSMSMTPSAMYSSQVPQAYPTYNTAQPSQPYGTYNNTPQPPQAHPTYNNAQPPAASGSSHTEQATLSHPMYSNIPPPPPLPSSQPAPLTEKQQVVLRYEREDAAAAAGTAYQQDAYHAQPSTSAGAQSILGAPPAYSEP
ncbi:hypothetical protein DL96DRAFT_1625418 [Flagelloscypha sp. PMI_526]|nr:hypothetical protein DL96DRAFT_1625418 [Flagelloscypha sp. PMI_526]